MSQYRRVDRLEARAPWHGKDRALKDAKRDFWSAVAAVRFAPEAVHMTEEQRIIGLTPVQHLAWLQRFGGEVDLPYVMSLYGFDEPTTPIGYILARAYVPGDENL